MKTFPVILEYCGGTQTDALHVSLSASNPNREIFVLDNASPKNKCACITHQNENNSFVGGGILDCIRLAKESGADHIFYCVNDVELMSEINIDHFENLMESDPEYAMVSASLTVDSHQVQYFPWMVSQGEGEREVEHADLICCMIRLSFLDSFGGFPYIKSGWGYSWELAHQAKQQGKKIIVCNSQTVRHTKQTDKWRIASGWKSLFNTRRGLAKKNQAEAKRVYGERYGSYAAINRMKELQANYAVTKTDSRSNT